MRGRDVQRQHVWLPPIMCRFESCRPHHLYYRKKHMNIRLLSKRPHRKYAVEIENNSDARSFYNFLENYKGEKLTIVVNGESVQFDSSSDRHKYAFGFKQAFDISSGIAEILHEITRDCCGILQKEVMMLQRENQNSRNEINSINKKYMSKYSLMQIRKAAWEDRIAELEDDRKVLKNEVARLKSIATSHAGDD